MTWQTLKLKDVLTDACSGTWGKPPAGDGSDYPVLRSTNIHNGEIVLTDVATRSIPKRNLERYILLPGDILVTSSSGSADHIGKNALFDNLRDERTYLFSNFTKRLRPNSALVLPRFLYFYLNSQQAKNELQRIQNTTSGLRNLNIKLYLAQAIPVPPLSEQRRIVEILDQADALRKKRAEADAKAERILPALFYKMFGDPATNPRGWEKGKMGEVITETQYGTSNRAETDGEGIAVLRMNNIDSQGRLDLTDLKYVNLDEKELKKYLLEPGDLLFNRTNSRELVGKTGIWQGQIQAVPASYLIRFRVDRHRLFPEYVWAFMNTPFMKQLLFNKARHAIGMANINAQELRTLPINIPSISVQQAFVKSLAAFEKVSEHTKKANNQIDCLFQTLLHRAFSGDLTAKWREAHMKELLVEMEEQAKMLRSSI